MPSFLGRLMRAMKPARQGAGDIIGLAKKMM
jgi:hypothetical protein